MDSKQKKTNLVWMDLEMTGLDPETCTILEIGTVITDGNLKLVATGPSIAIHQNDKVLRTMESWSKEHHKKSGLTEECRRSKINMKKAEELVLAFVKTHCVAKTARLCGNSIWQDRRFLTKYMPKLETYLHYRMVDVSSIQELVSRWYPGKHQTPGKKDQNHRAMDDILKSIDELRYYRSKVFVSKLRGAQ